MVQACGRGGTRGRAVQSGLRLGQCYESGIGVAIDNVEAFKWYKLAAENGDADAQTVLCACYATGDGIAVDKVEAIKWYTRAADAGNTDAQHNLRIQLQ